MDYGLQFNLIDVITIPTSLIVIFITWLRRIMLHITEQLEIVVI